jgi:hypothetical protein
MLIFYVLIIFVECQKMNNYLDQNNESEGKQKTFFNKG